QVSIAGAKPGTRMRDRVWSVEDTRRLLAGLKPGESIYQPTLVTPQGFYTRYNLDPAVVQVTDCRPDLITCADSERGPVLRVIDTSASRGLTLPHRPRAPLYGLTLDRVREPQPPARLLAADPRGIWPAQKEDPQCFDPRPTRPPLEYFLEQELQPLLERP